MSAFQLAAPGLLSIAVLISMGGHSPAAKAQSLLPIVTCTGTEEILYDPGLSNTTQPVTVAYHTQLPVCLHVLNLPLLMPASSYGQNTAERTCTELLGTTASNRVINWSNGQTSTISGQVTRTSVNGNVVVVVLTGTIVSGLYAGKSVLGNAELTPLLGDDPVNLVTACASPEGLTGLRGTYNFNVLP